MEPQKMYVSGQVAQQRVAVPLLATAPLTQVFPWLVATGSAPPSLADEFALLADEALAWAELTLPSALDAWPEWQSE